MTPPLSICFLRKGESAVITGYRSHEVPIKVYEMGLLPGVVLTMKQRLPFNGPICIYIKDNPNAIALRTAEADLILIESLP
ncbi:ferrous iron transport protein A [Parapedobacter composti]|uniref:Ferrous iron transport protein A n=1 Tax=Parapedobacter composti TaxID=623281 RepID=A0A1I1FAJ7_9SPHI|nr:FeoA family protein [Parapedobacter composti]SFB94173.1 ferrous iron transport protein A [Parapedobacter composti]